jgi:HEAT repeat protein
MRSLEALPVCARALDDPRMEVALDAVRALGMIATPAAGAAIVARLRLPHTLPVGIVESALLRCYRGDAPGLLQATLESANGLRRTLARVLSEAAGPDLAEDFTSLASDGDADVRASAARILAAVRPAGSARLLCELACDKIWFVRLRAMLALGGLRDPYTLPVLVEGLCDRNRLVRLRAASALAAMDGLEHRILGLVEKTGDRYALQALVGALDRAGKIRRMVDAVADDATLAEASLLAIVRGGARRTVTEAAQAHPQESVRRRLGEILRDAAEPVVPNLAPHAETTKGGVLP